MAEVEIFVIDYKQVIAQSLEISVRQADNRVVVITISAALAHSW
jgi:hypothetical protein